MRLHASTLQENEGKRCPEGIILILNTFTFFCIFSNNFLFFIVLYIYPPPPFTDSWLWQVMLQGVYTRRVPKIEGERTWKNFLRDEPLLLLVLLIFSCWSSRCWSSHCWSHCSFFAYFSLKRKDIRIFDLKTLAWPSDRSTSRHYHSERQRTRRLFQQIFLQVHSLSGLTSFRRHHRHHHTIYP